MFLNDLKRYVGFTDGSAEALRVLHAVAAPHVSRIVDDFYATIQVHPRACEAISGGAAQIARLKETLARWLDSTLLGPHDESYFEARARIGRIHVRVELPQVYMFAAMNRIRVRLSEILQRDIRDPIQNLQVSTALEQIMDIELAIMLETYREDLLAKSRNAERLATIGQFAASIGHELRNPLAVIDSSVHLLRQHLGPDESQPTTVVKHLDRIASATKRSTNTISNLLNLASNRSPRRARVAIDPFVRAAIEAAELPPDLDVRVSVPPMLSGEFDADQIGQVLTNLLTNASQAMGGSGGVSVDGDALDDGVRIRVRDQGPGVPVDAQSRIFEPLFTTKKQGTGLGLALCRRILAAHDGTIDLEPSDRGASFVLWIPGSPRPV